jgi:nitrile hydratase accessory protein
MTDAAPVLSDLIAADALLRPADGRSFAEPDFAELDFAEPWMAQAFACALHLSRQGLFTWTEWVEVFSAEIKAHPQRPGEASNAAYYRQWLAALETIVGLKGAASTDEIDERQETWRQAYLNTPHGQPVELHHAVAAPAMPAHHHHHDRHRHDAPTPVTVSPAQQ